MPEKYVRFKMSESLSECVCACVCVCLCLSLCVLCAREEYTADRMPEISVKILSGRIQNAR